MKVKLPRVYIIDDDQVVLLLHKLQVKTQQLGEHLHVFSDAKVALESIISFDTEDQRILIFLDINMPEMNGWEFLDQLQDSINRADIKVIILTSSLSKSDMEKSSKFNMVIDYWEKPMASDQLIKLRKKMGDWLAGN
jgi:CheY-like chemotaxis protein